MLRTKIKKTIYILFYLTIKMFPLIAISAFFIFGVAFFAIGKDDFEIKRLKGDSNDTSY